MSAKDRNAEREVADYFHQAVRTPERIAAERLERGPRWPKIKQFGSGLLTGMAVGSVIRRFF